jgi:hypothetical protein
MKDSGGTRSGGGGKNQAEDGWAAARGVNAMTAKQEANTTNREQELGAQQVAAVQLGGGGGAGAWGGLTHQLTIWG